MNPRWSGSAELVERVYGLSVFGAHAAACAAGGLPRFDLASALTRNDDGSVNLNDPPVIAEIGFAAEQADLSIVAEAWDTRTYQLGRTFPGIDWRQWNGQFRDDVRQFVKGDPSMVGSLIQRLYGSDWLFPDGLVCISLGLWMTVARGLLQAHGIKPQYTAQPGQTRQFDEAAFAALIADRRTLWIPRWHIQRAYLRQGITADRLRLELGCGRTVKLLWLPGDRALPVLELVLGEWIGHALVRD